MRITSFVRNAALLIAVTSISVVAQQSTGYLKTKVDPGRAGVFIDGKYVGPAGNFGVGRKYAVAAGEHEVRLSEWQVHGPCWRVQQLGAGPAAEPRRVHGQDRRRARGAS